MNRRSALPSPIIAVALSAVLCLAACDVVRNLPVIQPSALVDAQSGQPIVLTATITQDGRPLAEGLVVQCEVALRLTPNRVTEPVGIEGVRASGPAWHCPLPPDLNAAVRPNQMVGVTWRVVALQPDASSLLLAESPYQETMIGCADPIGALREEQQTILARYGRLETVQDIHARGFRESHGSVSFKGMGVAFVKAPDLPSAVSLSRFGEPTLGNPDLLFFAPSGDDVRNVASPDEPYRLIGWAYAKPIPPDRKRPLPPDGSTSRGSGDDVPRPVLTCIPHHEWMIHAAGYHTLDGGFALDEPAGPPKGSWHGAIWDLHVFADTTTGIPKIRIANDDPPPAAPDGIDAPAGSFFYPIGYDQRGR